MNIEDLPSYLTMRVGIMSRVFALILWDGQSYRGLMCVLFPRP